MKPKRSSRLAKVWGQVPPLLAACLCGEVSTLSTLRLVNKEASRVALLGLRSYTLTLMGSAANDTNVGGARLLRHTRLQMLRIHMRLSGNKGGRLPV